MKNSTQDKIFKLTIRLKYIIVAVIGIGLVSFGLTCLLTSYELSTQKDLNLFISLSSIILGTAVSIVSIFWQKEIEGLIEKYKL